MVEALRERLRLVALLQAAGPVAIGALVGLIVVSSLVPAGTALALGELVERVHRASDSTSMVAAGMPPLVAFGVLLLIGHSLESMRPPLYTLIEWRIDGAHRANVARLTATSPTIGPLERSDVQNLIREARADPENWTECPPSQGAIALMGTLGRVLTVVSSSLVVARFSWWLVPLLVLPAMVVQQLNRQGRVEWHQTWRRGIGEGMRAGVWQDAVFSPAVSKELRVFGLGGLAGERTVHHLRLMFEPVWSLGSRLMVRGWRQCVLVLVPLSAVFIVVGRDAALGGTSVGVAMAVLSAGPAIYHAAATDPRWIVGGLASVRAFTRLRAELAETPQTDPAPTGAAAPAGSAPPLVRFERVGFTYPGTARCILDGLDLEIRPGEQLAIVGLNGAGKSTLIKLLAGLYEPTAGRITADGADIAAIGPAEWRRHIAVVFQDFVRYHLSAADNVALGNAVPPDREAIEAAAGDAGFDAVLAGLPSGWETPLARSRTGGVDLSGGQWQQVVLARALYAVRTGARLLVLDEPTAHLDVRTEFDVFARIAAHSRGASVVLISHRLSTVRQADRIVLLDGGRITESGTHDELIAAGGKYAEMFAIQADRFHRGFDDRIEEGELR